MSYIKDTKNHIKKRGFIMFQEHLASSKKNMNMIMKGVRNNYIRRARSEGRSPYLSYLAVKTGKIMFNPAIMDWEDDCPSWFITYSSDYDPKLLTRSHMRKLLWQARWERVKKKIGL